MAYGSNQIEELVFHFNNLLEEANSDCLNLILIDRSAQGVAPIEEFYKISL